MKILIRVQHLAGRDGPLARTLSTLPAGADVILDGPADDPNPWRGYRKCLERLGDATHVLVVQDDVVACDNLEAVLPLLVEARPDTLTSLFVGGLRGRTERNFYRALQENRGWAQIDSLKVVHVVALLWPVALAREFLEWAATATIPGHRHLPRSDDAIVGTFCRLTKRQVWATVPCLVEHPDDVDSTCHRRRADGKDRGRVAIRWIGPDADPTALHWSIT